MTIEPLIDISGNISGLTVACIDISERVQAENTIRNAMQNAEFASHAKTRFLSNMSHEIRTPLGAIQGFSELALDENATEGDRTEYLQTIKKNAVELTKLIGEILDLAKIEAGQSQTEIISFSIIQLAQEVISALSLQAKEKGIFLKLHFQSPFPHFVKSDPTKNRQILLNLLSNAIKFTHRGSIEILAVVEKALDSSNSIVKIEVKDSGIGLNPEQRQRLFQAFSQADSSTTRRYGGTGLGLDLSRRLAQSIGGNVVLKESEVGIGSTFEFTFDAGILNAEDFIYKQKPAAARYSSKEFSGKLAGLKVLLVDDSADNQKLFSKYLSQTGATVSIASHGREAIDLSQAENFDLVLMDLQMPEMDDYEATAKLKSLGFKTPVIALTANALKEEREKAMEMGFESYLTKPIDPVQLITALEKYLKFV